MKAEHRREFSERRGKAGRVATFKAREVERWKRVAKTGSEFMQRRASEPLRIAMNDAESRADAAERRVAEAQRSRGQRSRSRRASGGHVTVALSEEERARRAAAQIAQRFAEGGRDAGMRALAATLREELAL